MASLYIHPPLGQSVLGQSGQGSGTPQVCFLCRWPHILRPLCPTGVNPTRSSDHQTAPLRQPCITTYRGSDVSHTYRSVSQRIAFVSQGQIQCIVPVSCKNIVSPIDRPFLTGRVPRFRREATPSGASDAKSVAPGSPAPRGLLLGRVRAPSPLLATAQWAYGAGAPTRGTVGAQPALTARDGPGRLRRVPGQELG